MQGEALHASPRPSQTAQECAGRSSLEINVVTVLISCGLGTRQTVLLLTGFCGFGWCTEVIVAFMYLQLGPGYAVLSTLDTLITIYVGKCHFV